jgi:hypothetical protein
MKLSEEGIHVIKNCIPPSLQDAIEDFYFSKEYKFNYVWSEKAVASIIKVEDGPIIRANELLFLTPVIENSLKQVDVEYEEKNLILARILIQDKTEKNIINGTHVDTDKKCYSVVYYINDSDGDTLFYNKTLKDFPYDDNNSLRFKRDWKEKQKEIFTEIAFSKTPEKGTAVVFDGSIYHASSSSVKNRRCIFNFCYDWK